MRLIWVWVLAFVATPSLHAADDVLMFGGDIKVERVDIDALLADGPAKARKDVLNNHKQMLQLLRQTYLIRAMASEALERGLSEDKLFQAKLRRQRERMLYLERLKQIDDQPLPDFEPAAKEQYQGNPDAYTIPERVGAKHILIATTDRLPQYHSKEEALEIIKKVKAEADSGRSFEDLVAAYSEDPASRKNQGSLGLFGRGAMVKPVEEAVFAMHKPGQISDIVESQFGYHLIKLTGRYAAQKLPFEQEKEKIVEQLKKDFIQQRREAYFDELLKKNKASIYEDLLEDYVSKRLRQIEE
ncbi:MAG: peptidylprolyl isomerase [Candidatus Thiodiazotropha sp. (ex Dulcina madagascariensis)]|nr:peptidylprolyl isomerase [Candidatus Thiodiazotropha sp. (ex Dulcina madagascariensis)]MCU7925760.1 peptidylprolyl isomerase [Candidatus Thiodiazotropha sp. (ex Dulcina madagascariensis)]